MLCETLCVVHLGLQESRCEEQWSYLHHGSSGKQRLRDKARNPVFGWRSPR